MSGSFSQFFYIFFIKVLARIMLSGHVLVLTLTDKKHGNVRQTAGKENAGKKIATDAGTSVAIVLRQPKPC